MDINMIGLFFWIGIIFLSIYGIIKRRKHKKMMARRLLTVEISLDLIQCVTDNRNNCPKSVQQELLKFEKELREIIK